jgi:hypothetical protein
VLGMLVNMVGHVWILVDPKYNVVVLLDLRGKRAKVNLSYGLAFLPYQL